jgi:hypothetical protein
VFVIARRATKRTVAATALALALPVLAGCGMEAKDETQKEHSQVQAADNYIGAIKIRDAFLTTLPSTGTTYLVVTLVNDGKDPDFFTGVTTSLGTTTLSGAVKLPPGVVVQVSDPDIDATAPTLVVDAVSAPVVGTTEPVSFTFTRAGTTRSLQVPVVDPGGSLSPVQVIPTTQATVTTPIV